VHPPPLSAVAVGTDGEVAGGGVGVVAGGCDGGGCDGGGCTGTGGLADSSGVTLTVSVATLSVTLASGSSLVTRMLIGCSPSAAPLTVRPTAPRLFGAIVGIVHVKSGPLTTQASASAALTGISPFGTDPLNTTLLALPVPRFSTVSASVRLEFLDNEALPAGSARSGSSNGCPIAVT